MSPCHNDLAEDLAGHLRTQRRMVWTDIQLGPTGSPRPDVYAIYKSFAHPAPAAYEVKVSLSDFRADVTAGKWQTYLPYASGVYFAAEAGLLNTRMVPEHCGLIVRGPTGWRAAKKPILAPVTIPEEALLKLLIDGIDREGPQLKAQRWINTYGAAGTDHIRQKLGEQVAACVRDLQTGDATLRGAQKQAERIVEGARQRAERMLTEARAELPAIWSNFLKVLGLPEDAELWDVKDAVERFCRLAAESPSAREHRMLTEAIRRALEHYAYGNSKEEGVQP